VLKFKEKRKKNQKSLESSESRRIFASSKTISTNTNKKTNKMATIAITKNAKTTNTHKTAVVELSTLKFRSDINTSRVEAAKTFWLNYQHDNRYFNAFTGVRKDYEVSGFYFAEVTESGDIINGNHRLTALMQLGYTHAEVEIC
jgi:arginyl-tRNA synthetase